MDKIPAKILVVDDDHDILTAARVVLRQRFATVETESNPQKLKFLLQQKKYDVILLDMNFSSGKISGQEGLMWLDEILLTEPGQQVVIITAYGDIKLAVEAMKHGAADFIVKPWANEKLEATVLASFQHGIAKKEIERLKNRQSGFTKVVNKTDTELIGQSPLMKQLLLTAERVAATDANVLILGENGTGKELLARVIHEKSHRRDKPFIRIDAASIAPTLFESELFGHRKGAFTDARENRMGRIELANEGTLFLDEIGNIPLHLQSRLLTALQTREVVPVGGNDAVPVDVRLISATNLNLHEAVRDGLFREDLLYRINTVEINVPPLRMRIDDIPLLLKYYIRFYSTKYRKEARLISQETIQYLQNYSWPGNVRELQHAVERAVIMAEGDELTKQDFLFSSRREIPGRKESLNLDEMEKKAIVQAIRKYHGNMTKVAKELGVGRTTLYRKMIKYGLNG